MSKKHVARNIVNQILEGAVESGAYRLVDMKKRQEFNDVADSFVLKLLDEESKWEYGVGWKFRNQIFGFKADSRQSAEAHIQKFPVTEDGGHNFLVRRAVISKPKWEPVE